MASITQVGRPTDTVTIAPGSGISITQTGSPGSYVYTIDNTGGGGGGAPTDAEYLVAAAHALLSAERITTDTSTVSWDHTEAGKAKANVVDASITFAKMQSIATDRLLGRDTAASGSPEELTVGGGIEFTGSGGIQRSALTGDVTATAGSNSTTIANDAVTDAKLRNSGALSVVGRSANSAGDPADISATAASDAVLRESGSVIGFGTIATGGIANDAVTFAKMQNVSAASKLLGRGSAGGAGDPEEITLGTNLSMSGTTLNATGGGSATATTIESNFGSTPVVRGKFTITDAAIGASSKVLVWQAPGPYTGKGTLADEASAEPIDIECVIPSAGSAVVHWRSKVMGGFGLARDLPGGNNARASVSALAPPQDDPQVRWYAAARGLVKGNFKFSYSVFA